MSEGGGRLQSIDLDRDSGESPGLTGGALGGTSGIEATPDLGVRPRRYGVSPEIDNRLREIIEGDIVPQLMLAGEQHCAPGAARRSDLPTREHIHELAATLVGNDEDAPRAFVVTMRSQGFSLDSLFLDLMAPAARHLGELWLEDLCSFADVTVGLCRLHGILRGLGASDWSDPLERGQSWRVLLAPAPGEQHIFGLAMAAEFFRRAGWDVRESLRSSSADLARLVLEQHFDVLGISASCESHLNELKDMINTIRKASSNKAIGVIVGGRVFTEHPELVRGVGADLMAGDGREGPRHAEALVRLQKIESE